MMISVIIPVYNEEGTITDCLSSLSRQSYKDMEIIVVDDGSTDKTLQVLSEFPISNFQFHIMEQKHLGPGKARNLGAKYAKGEILVFVDADMTFDKNFIKNLIKPIVEGKTKGTFTKDEFVSNWDNVWARCWNYNEGSADNRRIPNNYPDNSPVFRAILQSEFNRAGGYDNIGFTDDWTLFRKLGYKATTAVNAVCFHQNPGSLREVYIQARWIGKNEFISGSIFRKTINIIRLSLLVQIIRGFILAVRYFQPLFPFFLLVYYTAINTSILASFREKNKYK